MCVCVCVCVCVFALIDMKKEENCKDVYHKLCVGFVPNEANFSKFHIDPCWGSLHRVVTNMDGCNIVSNEFELHSRYCIHFGNYILDKCMNSLFTHNYG